MTDPFDAAAAAGHQLQAQLAQATQALAAETAQEQQDEATIAALQAQVTALQNQLNQPTGPAVDYDTLIGASFSKRANSAPAGNLVRLPAGLLELTDFTDGQNSTTRGASDYGAWLRCKGITGAGPGQTELAAFVRDLADIEGMSVG